MSVVAERVERRVTAGGDPTKGALPGSIVPGGPSDGLPPGFSGTASPRLTWWHEAMILVAFCALYSWARNQFGSSRIVDEGGVPTAAFSNAELVIRVEQALGTFHEAAIQAYFISSTWFIELANAFYGIAHFVVTFGVFIALFVKRPDVFRRWRNSFVAMNVLAVVGFAMFPLMPPRLLDQPCPTQADVAFGGQCIASDLRDGDSFGFVDTLATYGGSWSFDSDAMAVLSNQYAAMPSLHVGWAVWSAAAAWSLLRGRWGRAATVVHPIVTFFATIVTANHFWLDGIGGLIVVGLGAVVGWRLVPRWSARMRGRRGARHDHSGADDGDLADTRQTRLVTSDAVAGRSVADQARLLDRGYTSSGSVITLMR